MGTDVVLLRTGKLYEADLVANTFDDRGIPYYRSYESLTGLKLAMPLSPAQGPGESWVIKVPETHAAEAKAVIEELPVSSDPDPGVWDFGPSLGAKRFYRGYAWLVLVVLAIVLAMSLADFLGK